MFTTLLALSLAGPIQDGANRTEKSTGAGNTANLDGNWTIISLEKDGQPVAEAKNMTVMVKDNTITCSGKDGKAAMTWKVDFADKGVINVRSLEGGDNSKATQPEARDVSKRGVYVLTSDVLAICVHDGSGTSGSGGSGTGTGGTRNNGGTNNNTGGTGGTNGSSASTPQQKSHCSIILKREGSTR